MSLIVDFYCIGCPTLLCRYFLSVKLSVPDAYPTDAVRSV